VYIHAIGSANPLSFHTVLKPREMIWWDRGELVKNAYEITVDYYRGRGHSETHGQGICVQW
jgi:hypothetical protein